MPDPTVLSEALLRREWRKWRDRVTALRWRLDGAGCDPVACWEYVDLREALSFAESELAAIEAEVKRRGRGA